MDDATYAQMVGKWSAGAADPPAGSPAGEGGRPAGMPAGAPKGPTG